MAFDRQAAKQAGYSDDEIDAYLQSQPTKEKDKGPVQPGVMTESSTEPPPPSTVISETGGGMGPALATAGMAVAPYVVPTAGVLAAGIGGSKIYNAWKAGTDAAQAIAQSQAQQAAADRAAAQGLQQRFEQRMAQQATQMPKPTASMPGTPNFGAGAPGTAMPTNPYQMPTAGPVASQPAPMPSAPATATAATPKPNMIQRGTDIANQMRQFAAQRVIPAMGQAGQMVGKGLSAAAPALRVGGMASNALYSGDLNANEQQELERRRKMSPTITR